MHRAGTFILMLAFAATGALAQSSASYRADEGTLNNGGRPLGGATAASASFLMSLEALGDPVAGGLIASRQYGIGGGFGAAHPPAGEVQGLKFLDPSTLGWLPEPSAWTYNLYRGAIADLHNGSNGACYLHGLAGTGATDKTAVPLGDGFFYLVSAVNGLAEEGTLGYATSGAERFPAPVCP